jgi:hypothetical protein
MLCIRAPHLKLTRSLPPESEQSMRQWIKDLLKIKQALEADISEVRIRIPRRSCQEMSVLSDWARLRTHMHASPLLNHEADGICTLLNESLSAKGIAYPRLVALAALFLGALMHTWLLFRRTLCMRMPTWSHPANFVANRKRKPPETVHPHA